MSESEVCKKWYIRDEVCGLTKKKKKISHCKSRAFFPRKAPTENTVLAFLTITSSEPHQSPPLKAQKEQKCFKASRILFRMNSLFLGTKSPKVYPLSLNRLFSFYSHQEHQKPKRDPFGKVECFREKVAQYPK